nr:copia protein [Tanacetum cinerariifolium]
MSTQQDIYAASSESLHPMLNKENYVPWSSRLLRYAKSRPNGKLIYNSILNGPYVRKMIPEPGAANREITVTEIFHLQIDDELSDKELKQIEADDQAIQTILLDELKAERLAKTQDPLALMANSNNPYAFPAPHQDQSSFNQNYLQQPMPNPEDITDPTTAMNMKLALMAKAFKLNYSTPINNNQRISSNPRKRQIAQPGNGNQNQIENGNLVAARAEENAAGQNGNQIRCYNCRGVGHYARNCTVRPRRRDAGYLLTQLLTAQNKEAGIQLQQASTSGTQTDSAPIYDSDGSAEVHENYDENYDDNEIFNMFTQEEQYTELLEPIPESHQVPQNDNNVISENTSVEQGQSIQKIHMLSSKPDSFYHTEQKMALGYQNPFYLKQAQKKQQILYDGKVLLEKHDPPVVYDSEETLQLAQETNVSKSISIPNEDFSDDTTPSVARKFLNEVKSTIVTLQRVIKQRMTIEIHNWSSSAHQELYKIVRDENFPIINQVDARLQNFKIHFMKEAAKFVGDFKSLANEADASLAKHKALELEIKRLLKAVVSQDIMIIVQNESVVDTSDLQTELEQFQVLNYARENAHLKATYKNLFDSIFMSRTQTKTIIASLQNELQITIYKNAKLRTQLFKKVSNQKDNTQDKSKNTKFAKQPIVENLPKVGETNALSKPVTSNSVSTPQESKGVNNDKVIAPGMFRINPFKTFREENHVPKTVSASTRTKPITVSQPPVITKKDVNSDVNGLSSTGVDNTKTRRPQPRSNTKHDRVLFASKRSRSKNKEAEVEEHHKNLLLSKNNKHISSACNNIKIDSQDVISKVVYAMCNKFLISINHDKCLRNYVNGKNSRGKIVDSSESNSHSDCVHGDNACTSNSLEPKIKRFPNSTSLLDRNDHVAAILGFGDPQWGNILITRVYFIEGLGHNLFSVGQFCDSDLEVAFRRNACFVRNLKGVDLLKEDRSTNLYAINLHEMASASPICLMARASSTKSWLWHQRLSHLNLDTINDLARNDLVAGLPKFKYHKKHLCPSCEQGKSKRASHLPKPVPNSRQRLHLLYMDLCGPMRIASINGKRYVLVIVDDYSLERRNWTLVEAARTMLSFSRAPLFLWAEAIATACFTQNCSIIYCRFNKTPYELINGRKPDISFLHVFDALYYPKNDREDIGKLSAKGDIGFFIAYSADSCAYRIYNRRTKKIMETMNVPFDELSMMAFEQRSSKPKLQSMTSGQISSGLDLTYAPSTITTQQPSEGELDLLFEAMYDDYIGGQPSATGRTVPSMASTTIADTTLIPTNSSSHAANIPITSHDVDELNPNAMVDGNTFVNPFVNSSTSAAASSSLQNVDPSNIYPHEFQWTKDHPLEQNHFFKGTIDPTLFIRRFHDDILVAKPTEKHLKEVKRIFRYLRGTVNTSLWYLKDSGFELIGFSDADYAGCKDTFKSTSGGAQFLGEKVVSWSSKKQDCTALSTAKAEYVSLSACCAQVLWMRTQLTDYGFYFNKILIYCDSKSAIVISCNPVQHSRTKHVAVRYHFIKEHVEKGMIKLYFVMTDYQLADIFTKALPVDRFNYLVRCLGMRSLSPKELERLAKSQ